MAPLLERDNADNVAYCNRIAENVTPPTGKASRRAGPARTLGRMGWRDKGDFDITEPGSIGGR
jgi:hypothetical protein